MLRRSYQTHYWLALVLVTLYSCSAQEVDVVSRVRLVGILDTDALSFAPELFNNTIEILNEDNGFHDDDAITIDSYELGNSACNANTALQRYWDFREKDMNFLIAGRCSGVSLALANITPLDNVAQISPVSTSTALDNLSTFHRLVAPDDARGEVGALSLILEHMGWSRVTMLSTNTQFASDLATEFRIHWTSKSSENKISYSGTFKLDSSMENGIDPTVISNVLNEVPVDDPSINSRIILLAAHDRHAYEILRIANKEKFQPDTIWIAMGWAGTDNFPDDFKEWVTETPGIIGLRPSNVHNEDFMDLLQKKQLSKGQPIWENLEEHYAMSYLVDSIIAAALTLSKVGEAQRRDGAALTAVLRELTFVGLTGPVAFDNDGNRRNPQYNALNLQKVGDDYEWIKWGSVQGGNQSSANESVDTDEKKLCLPVVGCEFTSFPSDRYPVPIHWSIYVVPIIGVLFIILLGLYWRSQRKKKLLKNRLAEIDDELEGIDDDAERARIRKEMLIRKRFELQDRPSTWSDVPEEQNLVNVDETDDQYWDVTEELQKNMPDAHISKLWRIQNNSLWTYYSFHKDRLESHGVPVNEKSVWHGTSSLDPSAIYNGKFDGFMIQYAADGFWGRGIYFAAKSSYSMPYAFKTKGMQKSVKDRPRGNAKGEECEMFLAKLIRGSEVDCPQDRSLTVPPINPRTKQLYNTVTGVTAGSQVWIVYENGRAYPDYLVRYYKGPRDPGRTKFASREEAMKHKKSPSKRSVYSNCVKSRALHEQPKPDSETVVWEYEDNHGWEPYGDDHGTQIEKAYQDNTHKISMRDTCVTITSLQWEYTVNISKMFQINVGHIDHTKRAVRRSVISSQSTISLNV